MPSITGYIPGAEAPPTDTEVVNGRISDVGAQVPVQFDEFGTPQPPVLRQPLGLPALAPAPGSQPTGTGPIPGIASTVGDAAPLGLPVTGPNYVPPGAIPAQGPPQVAGQAAQAITESDPRHPGHRAAFGGAGSEPGLVQRFDQLAAEAKSLGIADINAYANAVKQQGQQVSGAIGEKSKTGLANAMDYGEKAAQVAQHNAELDAIDAANLKRAQDYTIPDFWEGKTGKLVGSAVTVALAGIGAGLLGSTNNQALQVVTHNIDQYMHQQKEKVDNLYKYAEQQGKLNAQTRMNYAQDLINLQAQHAMLLNSAADHIDEVKALSGGAVDEAKAKALAGPLRQQAIENMEKGRQVNSQLLLQKSQMAENYASAAQHRAAAASGGLSKLDIQILNNQNREFDQTFRKEAIGSGSQPGPVRKLGAVEETKRMLHDAMASGDPNRIAAAVVEIKEKVGPLLAGGRTTSNLTKQIEGMKTLADEMQANIGKLTGNSPVGRQYAARMNNLLDASAGEAAGIAADIRNRAVNEYLGPGGKANTKQAKDQFLSNIRGTFEGATLNGQPLFQNDPNAAQSTQVQPTQVGPGQSLPPGLPPGARPAGKTRDGRDAYRLPNGTLVVGS
jgi:hypothetical protein